jgi:cation transport ATPase
MATKKENTDKSKALLPEEQTAGAEEAKVEKVQEAEVKAASTDAAEVKITKKAPKKPVVIDVKAKEPQAEMKEKVKKADAKKAETPKAESEKAADTAEKTSSKEQKSAQPAVVDRGALFFGGGLLIMGMLLLMGRLLQIPFGVFIWPFIFIVPGVLVFLTALSSDSSSGEGLSILGGILTTLGAVFLAQSVTNLWASWAYAWALVAPTSIGFSQMIYGERKGRDAIVRSGRRLANIGLTIFAIGFVFFELILGVSGFGLGRLGLPVFPMILIFVGLVVLIRSYLRNRS